MLTIKNLSAVIDSKELLKNINLTINPGEIHVVMGPSKSGKSSLAHIIAGHPNLIQSEGSIHFHNKDLKKLDSDDRSILGIFSIFQYMPEIEGLTNFDLVKLILKLRKDKRSEQKIEQTYKEYASKLGLRPDNGSLFLSSTAMSLSEIKKNEILQMLMVDPNFIILDQLDDGLSAVDIEIVSNVLSSFFNQSKSLLIFSDNKKFLDLLNPEHVHILVDGEIKISGDSDLYKRITNDGYSQFS